MDLNAKVFLSFDVSRFQGRSAGSIADERSCSSSFPNVRAPEGGHDMAKKFDPGGPFDKMLEGRRV